MRTFDDHATGTSYPQHEDNEVFRPLTRREREEREAAEARALEFSQEAQEDMSYRGADGVAYAPENEYAEAQAADYPEEGDYEPYSSYGTPEESYRPHEASFRSREDRYAQSYEEDAPAHNYFRFDKREEEQNDYYASEEPELWVSGRHPLPAEEAEDGQALHREQDRLPETEESIVGQAIGKVGSAVNRLTGHFKTIRETESGSAGEDNWREAKALVESSAEGGLRLVKHFFSKNPTESYHKDKTLAPSFAFVLPLILFVLLRPLVTLFDKLAMNRYFLAAGGEAVYRGGKSYFAGLLQSLVILALFSLVFFAYRVLTEPKKFPSVVDSMNYVALALLPQILFIPFFIAASYLHTALAEAILLFAEVFTLLLFHQKMKAEAEEGKALLPPFWMAAAGIFLMSLVLGIAARIELR